MMHIPVSQPWIDAQDVEAVRETVAQADISGLSPHAVPRFEDAFAERFGVRNAVATTSGTTALHVAIRALGVGPGDEVLVAAYTNMASFFGAIYCGARAIPVDIDPTTLCVSPRDLHAALTPRTRAIVVVHAFGRVCDMNSIMEIARQANVPVVEDAAQAHGALYNGRAAGAIGTVGCYSFYANKLMTTGEGGMVVTDDDRLAARVRDFRNLCYGTEEKFRHSDVGFTYRMTGMQAALGLSQLKKLDTVVAQREQLMRRYNDALEDLEGVALLRPQESTWPEQRICWMYHIRLAGRFARRRGELMRFLASEDIGAREGFLSGSLQESLIKQGHIVPRQCPVAEAVSLDGLYIPSGINVTPKAQDRVCSVLRRFLGGMS